MKKAVTLLAAIMLMAFFSASSFGANNENSIWDDTVEDSTSDLQRWYVSFGVDFRTDEREYSTVAPSLLADLIYYSGKAVALKAGLGYNHRSLFDNSHNIRTFLFDAGVRVQDQRNLFSPFLETGIQFTRYEENDRNVFRSDNRVGVFFSIGLSARIDSYFMLDVKLKQSVNHLDPNLKSEVMSLPENYMNTPDHGPVDGYINQPVFGESLYNPTTFEMSLRIPL